MTSIFRDTRNTLDVSIWMLRGRRSTLETSMSILRGRGGALDVSCRVACFCESQCQGCVKWSQCADCMAGMAFWDM